MRVICIDEPDAIPGHENVPTVKEGSIMTVRNEGNDPDLGEYYTFMETPWHVGYSKIHFVPLSEIDETEFERNYKTETV